MKIVIDILESAYETCKALKDVENEQGSFTDLMIDAIGNGIPLNKKKYERFLPCTCGRNSRSTWFGTSESGDRYIKLVCKRCGKFACGKNETDAKRNWNKMIRGEVDADSN